LTLAEVGHGLVLIGTGVGSPTQMSVVGVEYATKSEYRFLEGYTSMLGDTGQQLLETQVGTIEILMRGDIENPRRILELAKDELVSLLVVGDPLQATTHIDLLLRCHDEGIPYEVIHATSVTTLVSGGIGLQNYRFGRQVTLTFPVGDYLPTSPLEMLCESLYLGNHVLVLFDLDPTGSGDVNPVPMTPEQAVLTLELMAQKLRHDLPPHLDEGEMAADDVRGRLKARAVQELLSVPLRQWFGILCSDLGTMEKRLRRGSLGDISRLQGGEIHCLVIPGELQGLEAEAVDKLIPPA
jgi:diphthine synthase